jgi:hypothetical protein
MKDWDVAAGKIERGAVAPAFEQPGGGIQYMTENSVEWLIDKKYLVEVFD